MTINGWKSKVDVESQVVKRYHFVSGDSCQWILWYQEKLMPKYIDHYVYMQIRFIGSLGSEKV